MGVGGQKSPFCATYVWDGGGFGVEKCVLDLLMGGREFWEEGYGELKCYESEEHVELGLGIGFGMWKKTTMISSYGVWRAKIPFSAIYVWEGEGFGVKNSFLNHL